MMPMKCPYRISVHKKTYMQGDEQITKEQSIFEDCYYENCPFYIDSPAFTDPICARVYNEIGGEL